MAQPFIIGNIEAIGPELRHLASTASEEGFQFMARLIAAWEDASNRFDKPGEAYFGVWADERMVAAGGLNRDPYCADATVGRVRHVYACPSSRRTGAGTALMTAIVAKARGTFGLLRLRTTTARGAAFYEALGFERCDAADASHILRP